MLSHVRLAPADACLLCAQAFYCMLGSVVSERVDSADGSLLSALPCRMWKGVSGVELALFPRPAGSALGPVAPISVVFLSGRDRCARLT